MKKLALGLLVAVIAVVGLAAQPHKADAYTYVHGYYRSNGTYVQPYVRSNPNGLRYDNYSYRPSQPLYNSSYGTRGYSWNTPSWNTDSSYYSGRSLYYSRYR